MIYQIKNQETIYRGGAYYEIINIHIPLKEKDPMEKQLKILITNDDGIESSGLRRLAEAATEYGEVWVVAPDGQRSAASHSLTIDKRVGDTGDTRIFLHGTSVGLFPHRQQMRHAAKAGSRFQRDQ